VIDDCKVKPIYALSPQARGKIERPYGWLQDRIVRTCARDEIKTIQQAQKVLEKEITRYNYRQVHSTTDEIPIIRFERATREKKSLFREFKIPSPYTSVKDIFCLRVKRKGVGKPRADTEECCRCYDVDCRRNKVGRDLFRVLWPWVDISKHT